MTYAVRVRRHFDHSCWTATFLTNEGQHAFDNAGKEELDTILDIIEDFADELLPGQSEITLITL